MLDRNLLKRKITNAPYIELVQTIYGPVRIYIDGEQAYTYAGDSEYNKCSKCLELFLSYYIGKDIGIDGERGYDAIISHVKEKFNMTVKFITTTKNGKLFHISNE